MSNLLRRAAVLSLSLSLASTACSKKKSASESQSPVDTGSAPTKATHPEKTLNRGGDFQRACYELGKTRCMQIGQCSQFATVEGNFNACLTRTVDTCGYELAPPLGAVTIEQVKACTKAQANAACTMTSQADLSACERPPGTLANGAACTVDAQCSTNHCKRAHGAGCGKCDAPLAEGAPCEDGGCGIGSLACTSGKCVRPRDKGEDCDNSEACKGGLICKAGKCDPAPSAGAACDPAKAEACDPRSLLKCDPKTKKCVQSPSASIGSACGDTGPTCEGRASCKNGKCVAPIARGKPCTDADTCDVPGRCVGGVCTVVDVDTCPK
jgi:hypothetical protein